MTEQTTWTLYIGIHQGTMISRDCGTRTTKHDSDEPLLTLEDVRVCANLCAANFAKMGYQIWYATAKSSTGEKVLNILPSTPYR